MRPPVALSLRCRRAFFWPDTVWEIYRTQRRMRPNESRLTSLRKAVKFFHYWVWYG